MKKFSNRMTGNSWFAVKFVLRTSLNVIVVNTSKHLCTTKDYALVVKWISVVSDKMPWYQNIVPESIKKNVCAYLLQRYLGQFFEEKLTRDQLNVDLYNGRGSVEKISLDVQVGSSLFFCSTLILPCLCYTYKGIANFEILFLFSGDL